MERAALVDTRLAVDALGGSADPNVLGSQLHPALSTRVVNGVTWQSVGYKSRTSKLVLGKRTLPNGPWTLWHYDGVANANMGTFAADSHNCVVTKIDADGYVHVLFNMHNSPLLYRRSASPIDTWNGAFAAVQTFPDSGTRYTYPHFLICPATGTLYCFISEGTGSGQRDFFFFVYNLSSKTWHPAPGTGPLGLLFQGMGVPGQSLNDSIYPNGLPKFSSDWDGQGNGFLHFSWIWRVDGGGTTAQNRDVCHAVWNGSVVTRIDGSPQAVPITIANSHVVWQVGPNVAMANNMDFDLDVDNRPLVLVRKNDSAGRQQLHWLYCNLQNVWSNGLISNNTTAETFTRFKVLIDDSNRAHVLGGWSGNLDAITEWYSGMGDFSTWQQRRYLNYSGVTGYELNYDYDLWREHRQIVSIVSRVLHPSLPAAAVPIYVMPREFASIDPPPPPVQTDQERIAQLEQMLAEAQATLLAEQQAHTVTRTLLTNSKSRFATLAASAQQGFDDIPV